MLLQIAEAVESHILHAIVGEGATHTALHEAREQYRAGRVLVKACLTMFDWALSFPSYVSKSAMQTRHTAGIMMDAVHATACGTSTWA
jgi:hypothetical protein